MRIADELERAVTRCEKFMAEADVVRIRRAVALLRPGQDDDARAREIGRQTWGALSAYGKKLARELCEQLLAAALAAERARAFARCAEIAERIGNEQHSMAGELFIIAAIISAIETEGQA